MLNVNHDGILHIYLTCSRVSLGSPLSLTVREASAKAKGISQNR